MIRKVAMHFPDHAVLRHDTRTDRVFLNLP
jgi:hypothetical protein